MRAEPSLVPLLVFEAAGCLMAVPAVEIAHLGGADAILAKNECGGAFDLGEYFSGGTSDGPWLEWARGACTTWLRVKRVVDVVPFALSGLRPMPALLRRQRCTHAFLAAGVRGDDVFLLLDPARLTP
jgi:hypothetical protein